MRAARRRRAAWRGCSRRSPATATLCHKAEPNDDSYPVVESYECFQQALGQPVTVTYDQVQDPEQVERWLAGAARRTSTAASIPGAHGGRCIFSDGANRPARITGMYEQFPYVVSVYAASPQAASRAWRKIVRQRPTADGPRRRST